MFKGAKLSQVLSVTKSYLECSIWLLSVMNTVHTYLVFVFQKDVDDLDNSVRTFDHSTVINLTQ